MILRIPYVAARASMSNAVYELCPVTGRVLDKNRLLCPARSERISMRARIAPTTRYTELWTRRTYCTSARTVFRTLIDRRRTRFRSRSTALLPLSSVANELPRIPVPQLYTSAAILQIDRFDL